MRPHFKYYKHASSCLGGDVVSRSGLYMRDARVRVGSSVGRELDWRVFGQGPVGVVGEARESDRRSCGQVGNRQKET